MNIRRALCIAAAPALLASATPVVTAEERTVPEILALMRTAGCSGDDVLSSNPVWALTAAEIDEWLAGNPGGVIPGGDDAKDSGFSQRTRQPRDWNDWHGEF